MDKLENKVKIELKCVQDVPTNLMVHGQNKNLPFDVNCPSHLPQSKKICLLNIL